MSVSSGVNMNQNTYQMNRHENNNSMNPFQRNGSYNNNNERNPFQKSGKYNNYNEGGGYRGWKNKTQEPEKPKVLTADDFPALPGAGPTSAKGVWGSMVAPDPRGGLKAPAAPVKKDEDDSDSDSEAPTKTLANRLKDVIAKEEEARLRGLAEKEEKEEEFDVIPLSSWLHSKHLAKKREEEMKKREMEEYEANYQWQMSRQMFPPKPEPPMMDYDEEFNEESNIDGFEVLEEMVEER